MLQAAEQTPFGARANVAPSVYNVNRKILKRSPVWQKTTTARENACGKSQRNRNEKRNGSAKRPKRTRKATRFPMALPPKGRGPQKEERHARRTGPSSSRSPCTNGKPGVVQRARRVTSPCAANPAGPGRTANPRLGFPAPAVDLLRTAGTLWGL